VPSYSLSSASAAVLSAISSSYHYGFDVMDMTGLSSGTVYPALRSLEQAGYVRAKWESQAISQKGQLPARKYYTITPAGEAALEAAVRRYPRINPAMPNLPRKPAG